MTGLKVQGTLRPRFLYYFGSLIFPHLIHGVENVVLWRRIHEVELQQVLHPQGLEQEDHIGEVGPLDLGDGGGEQLLAVLALRVEAVGLAGPRPARPTRTLFSLGLEQWHALVFGMAVTVLRSRSRLRLHHR